MRAPLISLLLALPLCALATEPGPVPGGLEKRAQNVAQWSPRWDWPSREQVAMRMMVRKLLLDRYDANADLELDADERRSLMEDADKARKQQAVAFIRRFDTDGDGKLAPAEREAMKQALAARRPEGAEPPAAERPRPPRPSKAENGRRPHGHRSPHMGKDGRMVAFMVQQLTMDAYDADKNGILDTQESARLKQDGAELYAAREAELLERFDSDGDGRLSESELMAARLALRPEREHARRPRHERQQAGNRPDGPPRPWHRGKGSIQHLLDTHFDVDIIMNLARPQGGEAPCPPCNATTP